MKLRLELFVRNLKKSAEFYSNILEFDVDKDLNQHYISLQKDDVVLGLGEIDTLLESHPLKASREQRSGLGVEIVLVVDDVRELYHKVISKEYPVHTQLKKRPWGLEDFRLIDPDGYYLRVTSTF